MQQFQQTFIDEANELLEKLEHDLLIFEKNPEDTSFLESILRAMHTLKGSGSMFGYDRIIEITHKAENLYTKIQNNEISVSEKVINISFSVSDLVKKLLTDDKKDKTVANKYNKVVGELNDFFTSDELEAEKEKNTNTGLSLFYINFEPDSDIENRGINLRLLFSQINQAGKTLIIPKSVSDEEKYPVNWEIFIATENDIDDLEEIMMFVDLECEITLISNQNLLLNKDFIKIINDTSDATKIRQPGQVLEIIKQVSDETKQESVDKKGDIQDVDEQKSSTLRVNAVKLDDLMKRVTEIITLKSEIKLTATLRGYNDILDLVDKFDNITSLLKNDVFEIRLVSLDTIRVNLERLIRDTSARLKKEVQFTHEGLNTELDKTIVDRLTAPLIHVIRNSIDHGIEETSIRAEREKTAHGNIKMKAFRSGSNVYVQIIDDGGGIDKEKIIQKAISKNFIKPGENLSNKDILELVLRSGFTTTDSLTAVSGRGVGMDVVKSEVAKLRGSIEIESEQGVGTTISLKLPLSLSIVDTLLIQTGDMYFSIPLEEINRCELTPEEELKSSENSYLKFDDVFIPYISLREVFKTKTDFSGTSRTVIVRKQSKNTAIIVDKIIGEFQAVVKPLGKAMEGRAFLSGGSLLADGNIAYLIDSQKLIEHYKL